MHVHTILMIKNRKLELVLKPGKLLFYVIFQKYVLLVVVADISESDIWQDFSKNKFNSEKSQFLL